MSSHANTLFDLPGSTRRGRRPTIRTAVRGADAPTANGPRRRRGEVIAVEHLSAVIVVANTVTLVFGGAITVLAHRAAARTGSSALRSLSVGLGLVTLGTMLGGGLHQLVGAPLLTSVALQSVFTATGFVALAYSLYADRAPVVDTVDHA